MKKLHKNLLVAGQLQEEDFSKLKEAGVTTIINNRPDGEEPGQMSSEDAMSIAKELGMAYVYLPMANGQPLPEGTVEAFKDAVERDSGNVLAHCRSGMRSSFIWALGAVSEGQVSVDEAIDAAQGAGIPLQNARSVLDSVKPS